LGSGEIRNSNGPYLSAAIAAAGAELLRYAVLPDEPTPLRQSIGEAVDAGAQVILSTGAVSMGRYDFVPDALRQLGATIHFHKVAIRPGKPLLFATLPNGALYFGLPGNPASSAVGLRFFVEPALRALLGLPPERPLRLPLLGEFRKRPPLRFHLKGHAALDADGRLRARVLPGQESFKIAPLAHSNCWIVVEADTQEIAEGALVDVYPPGHLLGLQLQGNP
jgi:molybdopterin molybdotransferase